ncbi:hypothetical protein [Caulobacter sp. 17J65-9]|uniref:bestrophin-like domain n=1 Tax=Caulobacter sp. 17J65-9 TaxID=2709382 RepID=UPI0013C9A587|nr:hypothetical protein [Caulobacter sp. 17J65-9]NEX93870.1 hypothetical protein [Caulobacter sp. 17J65-9]
MSPPPIEQLSLWLLAPLLALMLMAAHEVGVQLRRFNLRRAKAKGVETQDEGFSGYAGAIMGLMALLIGFTFGMAMDRFNTRRTLVTEEALDIGAHYRRLLTMPEPQRTWLASALIQYLDTREAWSETSGRQQVAAEQAAEVTAQRLWLDSIAALSGKNAPPDAGAVLGTTETMLRAAGMRREAQTARVPVNVIRAMLVYAVIAAVFIGYGDKQGRRLLMPSTIQMVLLALAISLILDLDTAHTGVIRVDEGPLIRVVERVKTFEAKWRAGEIRPPTAPTAPSPSPAR